MILVLSDTHGTADARLDGRTATAIREADLVCHCGDFMTESVFEKFESAVESNGGRFAAVAGNNDPPAVRDRLGDETVVEHDGIRLALVHGHRHHDTALAIFGRQSNADLVCVGHSHNPGIRRLGETPVLNPGSHAEPRRYRPAHAELSVGAKVIDGSLVSPDGETFERFELPK
ncbi:MAG: metallophosphoesterase [Halobacteriales archaeon]|nr:metallophosphoesterase [Halobacteriales archaeon]